MANGGRHLIGRYGAEKTAISASPKRLERVRDDARRHSRPPFDVAAIFLQIAILFSSSRHC